MALHMMLNSTGMGPFSKGMIGVVFISGKFWICLASLYILVSGSVATCVESMVLPSGSISSMVFVHLTVSIVGVSLLAKCIFAPKYAIDKLLLKR